MAAAASIESGTVVRWLACRGTVETESPVTAVPGPRRAAATLAAENPATPAPGRHRRGPEPVARGMVPAAHDRPPLPRSASRRAATTPVLPNARIPGDDPRRTLRRSRPAGAQPGAGVGFTTAAGGGPAAPA